MSERPLIIALILQLLLGLVLFSGWVMNIIKIIQWEESTGMMVVRIIGAFIAPLGGVLGWL